MLVKNPMRALLCLTLAAAASSAQAAQYSVSVLGGYQNGTGLRLGGTVKDATPGVPVAFSMGLGYAVRDPGDPMLARAVFINNNTNGTPEEKGHAWDLRFDAVLLLHVAGLQDAGVYAGVRHSWFTGDFTYVGGNEDFEITSSQWGYGFGVRGGLEMTRRWALAVSLGLDHYPSWTLTGHDATYSSDGTSVNARDDYTSPDADRAVHQPKLVPSMLVGVTWRPGSGAGVSPDTAGRRR